MTTPGGNILASAFRLIATQIFSWNQATRSLDPNTGLWVPSYAAAVTIQGSVQPIPRRLYEVMGLEMQRNYVNFFVPNAVIDVGRDVSGDTITFGAQTFQCLSNTAWINIDGWNEILAVQVA